MMTHNRDDFLQIAREYVVSQTPHYGILYVTQVPYRQLLSRVLQCLAVTTADIARDSFIWIP